MEGNELDLYEDMVVDDVTNLQELEAKLEAMSVELDKCRRDLEATTKVLSKTELERRRTVEQLHNAILVGKKAELTHKAQVEEFQAQRDPPPACPECCSKMNPLNGVPKPCRVKVLSTRNCLEVQFTQYIFMKRWCKAHGLINNSDGLPVLPEDVNRMVDGQNATSICQINALHSQVNTPLLKDSRPPTVKVAKVDAIVKNVPPKTGNNMKTGPVKRELQRNSGKKLEDNRLNSNETSSKIAESCEENSVKKMVDSVQKRKASIPAIRSEKVLEPVKTIAMKSREQINYGPSPKRARKDDSNSIKDQRREGRQNEIMKDSAIKSARSIQKNFHHKTAETSDPRSRSRVERSKSRPGSSKSIIERSKSRPGSSKSIIERSKSRPGSSKSIIERSKSRPGSSKSIIERSKSRPGSSKSIIERSKSRPGSSKSRNEQSKSRHGTPEFRRDRSKSTTKRSKSRTTTSNTREDMHDKLIRRERSSSRNWGKEKAIRTTQKYREKDSERVGRNKTPSRDRLTEEQRSRLKPSNETKVAAHLSREEIERYRTLSEAGSVKSNCDGHSESGQWSQQVEISNEPAEEGEIMEDGCSHFIKDVPQNIDNQIKSHNVIVSDALVQNVPRNLVQDSRENMHNKTPNKHQIVAEDHQKQMITPDKCPDIIIEADLQDTILSPDLAHKRVSVEWNLKPISPCPPKLSSGNEMRAPSFMPKIIPVTSPKKSSGIMDPRIPSDSTNSEPAPHSNVSEPRGLLKLQQQLLAQNERKRLMSRQKSPRKTPRKCGGALPLINFEEVAPECLNHKSLEMTPEKRGTPMSLRSVRKLVAEVTSQSPKLTPLKRPANIGEKSPFKLTLHSQLTVTSADEIVKSVLTQRKNNNNSTLNDFSHIIDQQNSAIICDDHQYAHKYSSESIRNMLKEMSWCLPQLSPVVSRTRRVPPLEAAIGDIESWSVIKCSPWPHHSDIVSPIKLKRQSDGHAHNSPPVKSKPRPIAIGGKLRAMQRMLAEDEKNAKEKDVGNNTKSKSASISTTPSSFPNRNLNILTCLWKKGN